jgi:hypothetical protein
VIWADGRHPPRMPIRPVSVQIRRAI